MLVAVDAASRLRRLILSHFLIICSSGIQYSSRGELWWGKGKCIMTASAHPTPNAENVERTASSSG